MNARPRSLHSAAFGAGLLAAACLPKDTRPEPGRLDVTVTANPVVVGPSNALSTVDGWTIRVDRALVALRASLSGDACADYYRSGYTRIFDLGVAGPQRQSTLYSLGHCDFGFRLQSPNLDPYTPLGAHVTQADHDLLNQGGVDPYTVDQKGAPVVTGTALYVTGHASKGAVEKTFTWSFRQRVSYRKCASPHVGADGGVLPSGSDAGPVDSGARDAGDAALPLQNDAGSPGPSGVELAGGAASGVDIGMHVESLFHDTTNLAVASLRFDALARADDDYGDRNGDVTLAELGLVPLPDVGGGGRYEEPPVTPPPSGRTPPPWKTLEDFVYLGLYPEVARYLDSGTCSVTLAPQGR